MDMNEAREYSRNWQPATRLEDVRYVTDAERLGLATDLVARGIEALDGLAPRLPDAGYKDYPPFGVVTVRNVRVWREGRLGNVAEMSDAYGEPHEMVFLGYENDYFPVSSEHGGFTLVLYKAAKRRGALIAHTKTGPNGYLLVRPTRSARRVPVCRCPPKRKSSARKR